MAEETGSESAVWCRAALRSPLRERHTDTTATVTPAIPDLSCVA